MSEEKTTNQSENQEAFGTAGASTDFIKETVRTRPINRKKLLRRTVINIMMAVIFGLVACFTFLVLEPLFNNWLFPEEEVVIDVAEDPVEEEILPEDMILEEETEPAEIIQQVQETVIQVQKAEMSVDDYKTQYANLAERIREIKKSLVTVAALTSQTDWLNGEYENRGLGSGIIIGDNGKEILILAREQDIENAEELLVILDNQQSVPVQVKARDPLQGLCVLAIAYDDLEYKTRRSLNVASFGNSLSLKMGSPIIAIGYPLGDVESVDYGMLTSQGRTYYMEDVNFTVLTTNIYGSKNASGFLMDMNGALVGVIRSDLASSEVPNMVTALGISEMKPALENMLNGYPIYHIGIFGTDVPRAVQEEQGMPAGAYVSEIKLGSPAMAGGIQSGDVVVAVGDEIVASFTAYSKAISKLRDDSEVTVTCMRQSPNGYQEIELTVIPQE